MVYDKGNRDRVKDIIDNMLVGDISPVADAHWDSERLDNVKKLKDVIEVSLDKMYDVTSSPYVGHGFSSVNEIINEVNKIKYDIYMSLSEDEGVHEMYRKINKVKEDHGSSGTSPFFSSYRPNYYWKDNFTGEVTSNTLSEDE